MPQFDLHFFFQIFFQSQWDGAELTGDLALVQLNQPVPFSQRISTVCLPSLNQTSESFARQDATVIGWGQTENGTASAVLRHVSFFLFE